MQKATSDIHSIDCVYAMHFPTHICIEGASVTKFLSVADVDRQRELERVRHTPSSSPKGASASSSSAIRLVYKDILKGDTGEYWQYGIRPRLLLEFCERTPSVVLQETACDVHFASFLRYYKPKEANTPVFVGEKNTPLYYYRERDDGACVAVSMSEAHVREIRAILDKSTAGRQALIFARVGSDKSVLGPNPTPAVAEHVTLKTLVNCTSVTLLRHPSGAAAERQQLVDVVSSMYLDQIKCENAVRVKKVLAPALADHYQNSSRLTCHVSGVCTDIVNEKATSRKTRIRVQSNRDPNSLALFLCVTRRTNQRCTARGRFIQYVCPILQATFSRTPYRNLIGVLCQCVRCLLASDACPGAIFRSLLSIRINSARSIASFAVISLIRTRRSVCCCLATSW